MCGIAGLVALPGADLDSRPLEGMLDRIVHRGPDDRGTYVTDAVALGMTRLAIVDLAGGHQPMSDDEGRVTVVFNGELYGYASLRRRLTAEGHPFRTNSDTEVLLRGYLAWGDDVLRRVRGMFALAIWDARGRRLLLARDRMGEKPLYVARIGATVAFASELKCLRDLPGFDASTDLEALEEYLGFGYVSAPATIHRGARKLLPGHCMIVEGGTTRIEAYEPTPRPLPRALSFDEAVAEVTHAIDEAVREQRVADVPIGAFLSGGVDSSMIVASMVASGSPVKTFSAGFEDAEYDERPAARAIAAHLGTDHHELVVRADLAHDLPRLVAHFDEPFGDKSMLPTYLVAREARAHVKVVLTGDGGDEVFGGYDAYRTSLARAEAFAAAPRRQAFVAAAAARFPSGTPMSFRVRKRALDPVGRFVAGSLAPDPDRGRSLLSPELRVAFDGMHAFTRRLAEDDASLPLLARMQRLDLLHYLPDDVLTKVDRMTMLASLESRAPLLDPRVVALGLALPDAFKQSGGTGKLVLRAALAPRVPPALLTPGKRGFGIPMAAWLDGSLATLVRDTLRGRALRESGWFDTDALVRLADRGEDSTIPSNALFRLVCLGLFLESRRGTT